MKHFLQIQEHIVLQDLKKFFLIRDFTNTPKSTWSLVTIKQDIPNKVFTQGASLLEIRAIHEIRN